MDNKEKYRDLSGPLFVMLDVTTACNFRCLHCYNSSGQRAEDEMSDDEILDVTKQICDIHPESVCLCGGETMLRRNLCDIIRMLSPNVGGVSMVSNGYLLNEKNLIEIKEAGINTIQISVDGINAMQHDTFRGCIGAFDKAIKALRIICGLGINSCISFVPNRLNYRSFPELCQMMHEIGVKSVRLMPLIPMGRGSRIESLLLDSDQYAELQLSVEVNKVKYASQGMLVEWGDPIDHLYRLPNNEQYGYKSIQYEIKANGDIGISTYLPIAVGNIRKHSLREYWDNGYNTIWYDEKFKKYRDKVNTIYDFSKLWDELENGEKIHIDLIDDFKEVIR